MPDNLTENQENMALSADQKAQMWVAYCEKQTAGYVAQKAGVHEKTAAKYIREEFKQRFDEIEARAAAAVDAKVVDRKVDALEFCDTLLSALAGAFSGVEWGDIKPRELVGMTDTVIRVRELLRGNPDSRPGDKIALTQDIIDQAFKTAVDS